MPSIADRCLAFSDSIAHVFERKITGTFNSIKVCIAGIAAAIKFGPLVITPSMSKRQAKLCYA